MSTPGNSPRTGLSASPRFATTEDLAAGWLARRESGLSTEEQAEFSQWLLADPRHAEATARLADTWRRLQQPRLAGQADELELAVAARVRARGMRRSLATFSLVGLAAAAALVFAFLPAGRSPATSPAAMEVRPDRRTLADGSVVEFNAGAEIEVNFTPAQRGIRLVRGEAHFAVTKDPARPFVVSAGAVLVRAVGTAFAVQMAPDAVGVLVTEGRVAVERVSPVAVKPDLRPEPVYLAAGDRVSVATETALAARLEPSSVPPAEVDAALNWRSRRVEFTGMRLAEVVALFNRQNAVQLALGQAALGEILVSGIFWSDDPEGFSRIIGVSAGLTVERTGTGPIVLGRLEKN